MFGQLHAFSIQYPFSSVAVHKAQPGWRRIIAQAVLWGTPAPAFSTALAFFDGYRSEIVPANLIQAQVRVTRLRDAIFQLTRGFFESVTTSVHTPSVSSPEKKTRNLRKAKTFVRVIWFDFPINNLTILFRRQLDWSWRERVCQLILCLIRASLVYL